MTGRDTAFASLLCSRLCHDLMSPVGAFANGLELLADEEDPALRAEYLALLEASARASTAKLKFFRIAFGAGGSLGAEIEMGEVRAALEGMLAERKGLELGWMVAAPFLPRDAARVLLNLGLIAGDALLRGGRLDIGAEAGGDGTVEIVIRAEGPRLVVDEAIVTALGDAGGDAAAAELTSRTAAAALVHALTDGSVQVGRPSEGVLLLGATVGAPGA